MFIDPHIHMTSRTVDDLIQMRRAGIVAIIEPSFCMGQPRTQIGAFQNYFDGLVGWERFRAGQFGIRHYCTIGLNPKEANQAALAEAVMDLLPYYVEKESVVGIGEIGFDQQTQLEEHYFRRQLELAKIVDLPIIIHTPERDKEICAWRSMDICIEHGLDPAKVIIDHNNETTAAVVLERGFWAGFTIYPKNKMSAERMLHITRQYGGERIFINSAADWGYSDPLAVPRTAELLQQMGLSAERIYQVCYQNALLAFQQSGKMEEHDWLNPATVDPAALYQGNSALRGQELLELTQALALSMII